MEPMEPTWWLTEADKCRAGLIGTRIGQCCAEIYRVTHGGAMDYAPAWVWGGNHIGLLSDLRGSFQGERWSEFKRIVDRFAEAEWDRERRK